MNLRDKLKEDTIILPIQAATQTDTIKELLTHLQNTNILTAITKLLLFINNNEKQFSCAAGRGVAYPHSTSKEVDKLTCVLGLSKHGIDFNSPDGQLCHIILLTLSSDADPCEHRKFITRFTTMMDNPMVRSQLLDANKPDEIINTIRQWEEDDALINDLN